MRRLKDALKNHKKHSAWVLAVVCVLIIGIVDSLTGPELSLSAFYLIPIVAGTYYSGIWGGMSISLASIIVYLIADKVLSISYSKSAIPYWNAGVRFLFFAAVAYVFAKRKEAETKRRNAENAVRIFAELHAIDRAIIAARSSEKISREALQRIRGLIPYQFASVTRFDFDDGRGSFVCVSGFDEDYSTPGQLFLETVDPQIMDTLKKGGVHTIVNKRQKGAQSPSISLLPFETLESCIIVPLLSQDNLIGSLNLGFVSASGFTAEHMEIAREVANQMAVALHNAHLYEELHAAHQRLQMLNHRLLEAQETERHHLARELHDEMGQALTVLRIQLEEIDAGEIDDSMSNRLKESIVIIEKILNQVRNLSLDLRPLILDDLGLTAAVRWYLSRKSQVAGFTVHFESNLDNVQLPAEIETACFRIAQEAITNILRHSRAKHVSLDLTGRNGEILFEIRDDGIGFDVEKAHQRSLKGESLGLLGMRERISLLGGQLEIESVPSCGTEVRVRVPIQAEMELPK